MKSVLFLFFTIISFCLLGQGSFTKYLEVGEPANLKELVGWAMNPLHAEEIKTKPELIEDFVSKAGWYFESYSDDDLQAWNACMKYLVGLGVPVNGKKVEDANSSLMFLTSPMNMGSEDSLSRRYLLHTILLELGGKTEIVVDGVSLLQYVLITVPKKNELYQSYLSDFKSWEIPRKRSWLFGIASSTDYDDDEIAILFDDLLKANAFDVNIRSKNDKLSLFDAAVNTGKYATADALLENSFNVNQRCFACEGQTALHNVVNKETCNNEGLFDLITKMLAKGGDPDLRDLKGYTPIHKSIDLKCEMAFKAFMAEETVFNYQLGTLKGRSYYTYFLDEWGDEDYLEVLTNKTDLKAPLTKKEIKQAQAKKKEEAKAKAKAKKKN